MDCATDLSDEAVEKFNTKFFKIDPVAIEFSIYLSDGKKSNERQKNWFRPYQLGLGI